MKVNELRIGNLVKNQKGIIEEIQGIYSTSVDIEVSTKSYIGLLGDFKPIPITEEWLIKFGFEKSEDGYWQKESTNQGFVFWEDDGCVSVPYTWIESVNDLSETSKVAESKVNYCMVNSNGGFEYVHQLQNLYFALTTEEL